MTLSVKKINSVRGSTEKKKQIPVQDGSGLYLVIEKLPKKCKRFVGKTYFIKGRKGKKGEMSFGVWGKDVKNQKDIQVILGHWKDVKKWSEGNQKHPRYFDERNKPNLSTKTLKEVFESFIDYQKLVVKEVTWKDRKNKLNQMLRYFGEETPLSDFELGRESREKVMKMYDFLSIGTREQGSIEHSKRCRNLLKLVFKFSRSEGWMDENPVEPNDRVGKGHIKKSNPTIKWKEVPELMNSIEEYSLRSSQLTQLCMKFYLMSCIRVGSLVRLKWDWFDKENNMWVIPPETTGLKRSLNKTTEDYKHIIPSTPEIQILMDELRKITGHQKYVFHSPEGRKYPHLNPETLNTQLHRMGWGGRLTTHGWRDVVVTSGQEEGGFPLEIIKRQIGHTEHKQGSIGHYDNTLFLEKRREFMEWWTKELVKQGMKLYVTECRLWVNP